MAMLVEKEAQNYFQLRLLDKFMTGHKGYIAGGCFKNLFTNQKIKDVDVFFENEVDFAKAQLYFGGKADQYCQHYSNDNVVAYRHIESGTVVELCRKVFGTPSEVISKFDFSITKFAYYKKNVDDECEYCVLCDEDFFEHLLLKRLVVADVLRWPMSTFERMIRYIKYGFYPCRETKIRIATALHEAPMDSIDANFSLYDGVD